MTQLDGSGIPGRPGSPVGVGTAVTSQPAAGGILSLLPSIDRPDDLNFPYWRQNVVVGAPARRDEGQAATADVIPNTSVLTQVVGAFTNFDGYAEYTDEGVSDQPHFDMAAFDEMLLLPARHQISELLVNPTAAEPWSGQGFNLCPEIEVDSGSYDTGRPGRDDGYQGTWFTEPTAALSRAMVEVAERYGSSSYAAAMHPRFGHAIRTERALEGGRAGGWDRLNTLGAVVEQPFGFGVDEGDTVAIVGVFSRATATVVWKNQLAVEHGVTGTQFREWEATARIRARYGFAMLAPPAFCRIVAG